MKILALTRYGRLGASSRLRTMQFLPLLKTAGMDGLISPLFGDAMLINKYKRRQYSAGAVLKAYGNRVAQLLHRHHFDLIWIEKEALPWTPALCERVLLSGVPYVLDYDDAIFHKYDQHRSVWVRWLLGRRIDRLMADARLVIAGNDYLAQRARKAGARWVEVLPTVVDLERYAAKPPNQRRVDIPYIVWIGSPSTVKYLAALEAPLAALAARSPFKLRVIGGSLKMTGVDVECVPWTEESEVQSIAECDIGVMPLNDSPWERGKCGYKLIQYMACGLPVVASPIGVNTKIVRDGVNGFLVTSADAWVGKLEQLLRDADLRRSMGREGRRSVEAEYCVQQAGPLLANLLVKAGARQACER
ncbi:glycosyltransferase involved in cell wall biosynthesis [Variovorax beijingensis]|uniref:Glycosyltransferase involved in cell wall biosynthesis n=1 Tax=Variovorax beijingensis TaxID=2496117 RepID=A0A561C4H9_9BURK|nr:glycosyltransferase family 4 protein [Variovorax beijingensis]TWD86096.1 glycosyltransferase involved in cell wall biosynthesis [Variovorax beijingensis]